MSGWLEFSGSSYTAEASFSAQVGWCNISISAWVVARYPNWIRRAVDIIQEVNMGQSSDGNTIVWDETGVWAED